MKNYPWILFVTIACTSPDNNNKIDIQGHRGARGLAPENSIPAFLMAAQMGINTLELDLVVSKDSKLVVSHEPYFSPEFCLNPSNEPIPRDSIINIYELDYNEIQQYDCGSKGNARFPEQRKISTYKPLLKDVLDSVESFFTGKDRPINYNIELKTRKETDDVFHPNPSVFSDMVYDLISEMGLWEKVNIQSFDFRTLQYFRKEYPNVKLALLIENQLPWKQNIDSLGFIPEIYSCYFDLLSEDHVKELQNEGMKVIPWTVNEIHEIEKMISLGVDGIITDYPNKVLTITKENNE
ncbi:MAG: glycerophosphodiester phosphodiesterase family protein [Bacteroidota bacterium]